MFTPDCDIDAEGARIPVVRQTIAALHVSSSSITAGGDDPRAEPFRASSCQSCMRR
jgi:hypothetical protein